LSLVYAVDFEKARMPNKVDGSLMVT